MPKRDALLADTAPLARAGLALALECSLGMARSTTLCDVGLDGVHISSKAAVDKPATLFATYENISRLSLPLVGRAVATFGSKLKSGFQAPLGAVHLTADGGVGLAIHLEVVPHNGAMLMGSPHFTAGWAVKVLKPKLNETRNLTKWATMKAVMQDLDVTVNDVKYTVQIPVLKVNEEAFVGEDAWDKTAMVALTRVAFEGELKEAKEETTDAAAQGYKRKQVDLSDIEDDGSPAKHFLIAAEFDKQLVAHLLR